MAPVTPRIEKIAVSIGFDKSNRSSKNLPIKTHIIIVAAISKATEEYSTPF